MSNSGRRYYGLWSEEGGMVSSSRPVTYAR
jgi:hypothetical protein